MGKKCKNCMKNKFGPICKKCLEILIQDEKNNFEYYQERNFNLIKPKKTNLYIGVISIDTFCNFYDRFSKKTSFDLLEDAVKILAESIGESSKSDWKGILVSPEFFFHRESTINKYGKYNKNEKQYRRIKVDDSLPPARCFEEKEYDEIVKKCKNLSKRYSNILIVPGSFLHRKKLKQKDRKKISDMVEKQNKKYADGNIFVKVVDKKCVPLIYSGAMNLEDAETIDYHVGHGSTYFVDESGFFNFYQNDALKGAKKDDIHKTIDKIKNKCTYMMRNTTVGFYQGKKEFIYHKKGLNADITTLDQTQRKTVFISGGEPNVVNFLGYKIGIEICQDHDLGLLSKLNKGEKVDLHFILSNTVDKIPEHLHASKKGFVIQSDRRENISGVFDCKGNKMKPMKTVKLKTKVRQSEKTLCIYACTIDAAASNSN